MNNLWKKIKLELMNRLGVINKNNSVKLYKNHEFCELIFFSNYNLQFYNFLWSLSALGIVYNSSNN